MKKLIIGLLIFFPLVTHADASLLWLGNGQGFDLSGQLQAFCLQDGSCYDISGKQLNAATNLVAPVTAPISLETHFATAPIATPISIQSSVINTPVVTPTPTVIPTPTSTPTPTPTIICVITLDQFNQQQQDLINAYNSTPIISAWEAVPGSPVTPDIQNLENILGSKLSYLRGEYFTQDPSCQH